MPDLRRLTVVVCNGPTCGAKRGSAALAERFAAHIKSQGLAPRITLDSESCFGHCLRGPNILVCDTAEIEAAGFGVTPGLGTSGAVLYSRMTADDVDRVVERHLKGGFVLRALIGRPPLRD